MSNCNDNSSQSSCCDNQFRSNCPPSPEPPWTRPVQSPQTQTLTGDGNISLTHDTTYLNQTTPKDSDDATVPYDVALPDGNYLRQIKRIYIPKANESTTAVFKVTGTIVGFAFIRFSSVGFGAVLEWVGDGWTWIGGNAELLNEE